MAPFGLVAIYQVVLLLLRGVLSPWEHELAWFGLYALTGVAAGWIGLSRLQRAQESERQAQAEVHRLRAELQRAREYLQMVHEVGRQVTNAADEAELLYLAARIPAELLGAQSTTVITFDEGRTYGELEMSWGLENCAVEALRDRLRSEFPAQRCAQCEPLTAHVNQDCPLLAAVREASQDADIERVMCMPLGRGDQRTGLVSAYLGPQAHLSSEEVRLASIVTAEISAALEGARLRGRRMATLQAVDRATQERQTLDDLLERVLAVTMEGWDVETGAILLAEGVAAPWTVRVQRGLGTDAKSPQFRLVRELAERARTCEQPLILQEHTGNRDLASVAVALLRAEGETIGALFLGSRRPAAFEPAQAELIMTLAGQIALAVRNAQLYAQLRQTAVLEERYRLSREIHDGLAQTLGYLSMQAERVERLAERGDRVVLQRELTELRRVVAEAYVDLREAIDDLRLPVDRPGALMAALQEQVDEFMRRTGLEVSCKGLEAVADLPANVSLHLLRIIQEALTNVRRHSQARRVWLEIRREEDHLRLTVADDGQGFDPAALPERGHLGLAGMRERVRSLEGELTVAASPGRGTRITVRIPLR